MCDRDMNKRNGLELGEHIVSWSDQAKEGRRKGEARGGREDEDIQCG
jgi:hypothetical protein